MVGSRAEEVHTYWRNPGAENAPETYAAGIGRSLFLLRMLTLYGNQKHRILEVGCNMGRNLAFLHHSGYTRLSAIEINESAVKHLRADFPELKKIDVRAGTVEELLPKIPDDSFDLIYTIAVLEHISYESDWIFEHLSRISPRLITIEDEFTESDRHFPRDYGKAFSNVRYEQVAFIKKVPDLPGKFRCRVFFRTGP